MDQVDVVISLAYRNKAYVDEDEVQCGTGGLKPTLDLNDNSKVVRTSPCITAPSTADTNSHEPLDNGTIEHEASGKDTDVNAEDLPDGGWGWVVAWGAFVTQIMVNVTLAGYGVLYSEFLLGLNTPAVLSTWIFNLMSFMLAATGMFLKSLQDAFGFRKLTFFGSFCLWVGVSATMFANSPWYLMFFFSFVAGLGNGLLGPISQGVIPYYFSKRIGIANGIMCCGVSLGQIIGPLFITYLQGQYGFKGGVLIFGGFLLHGCISAMVFHPIEWHTKQPSRIPKKSKTSERADGVIFTILKTALGNFRLFKSPVAVIGSLGQSLCLNAYFNFQQILPFQMQDEGFTVQQAADCLAYAGFANLATRIIVSILADFRWFNMVYVYMFGSVLLCVAAAASCFVSDLTTKTICICIWGIAIGLFMGLFVPLLTNIVGRQKVLQVLSFHLGITSILFISSGPIAGLIRDLTGSYTISVVALSASVLGTFVLYLFLPAAQAYEQRQKDNKVTVEGNVQTLKDNKKKVEENGQSL